MLGIATVPPKRQGQWKITTPLSGKRPTYITKNSCQSPAYKHVKSAQNLHLQAGHTKAPEDQHTPFYRSLPVIKQFYWKELFYKYTDEETHQQNPHQIWKSVVFLSVVRKYMNWFFKRFH